MKRLDSLVLKELFGPWLFGVAMFTMLILAAQYLGRIANFVVQGVPPYLIFKVTLLLLPEILVQTFAMALLLGSLLAFGRLSGDSEITAIRASGVSLYRIVAPVAAFSMLIAIVAFIINERVVPGAVKSSAYLMADIARKTLAGSDQPIKHVEVQDGRVVAMIGARYFNAQSGSLTGVNVIAYDKEGRETYILFAKELDFTDRNTWRALGRVEVLSLYNPKTGMRDGQYHTFLQEGAWPEEFPAIKSSPEDMISGQVSDLSTWSMAETLDRIRKGIESGNLTANQIRNYQYGYWNKIALPLAAFIFGTLGATLGIRNHRTGTATGFAVAIVIIFAYFMLGNFMNVFNMGGRIPPYVASFTPTAIGLIASGVIIWRRNR